MKTLADIVSMANIVFYILPIVLYLKTSDIAWIWLLLGLSFVTILHKWIKQLLVFYFPNTRAFQRPVGARDCNILCTNGDQSRKPGMPSGHMTSTCMFVIFTLFYLWNSRLRTSSKYLASLCLIVFIFLTAYARLQKKCHTLLQIMAGSIFGGLFGLLWFYTIPKVRKIIYQSQA